MCESVGCGNQFPNTVQNGDSLRNGPTRRIQCSKMSRTGFEPVPTIVDQNTRLTVEEDMRLESGALDHSATLTISCIIGALIIIKTSFCKKKDLQVARSAIGTDCPQGAWASAALATTMSLCPCRGGLCLLALLVCNCYANKRWRWPEWASGI